MIQSSYDFTEGRCILSFSLKKNPVKTKEKKPAAQGKLSPKRKQKIKEQIIIELILK